MPSNNGGIIISVASGMYDSAFGLVQDPMKALILRKHEAWMENGKELVAKVFHEFKLNGAVGTIQETGNIGEMEMTGENGASPRSEYEEGFSKILRPEEWKKSIEISQTAIEDQQNNILTEKASELMDAYHRTRNSFFWGLMGAALCNQDYARNKKVLSTKSMDGVRVFSTAHPSVSGKFTQSNAYNMEFSAEALDLVSTNMQNCMTDDGEIAGVAPDTIIIPNVPALKRNVFGVIGAYYDPEKDGGNQFNYQFDNWNVMVVPWLVPYIKKENEKTPWMLMASEYNKTHYGAVDIRRVEPSIKSYIDEGTDANVWKMRTRFSGAFGDWRAFAAGGLDFGV